VPVDTAKVEKLNKALKATEGSMKSIRQQTFDYNIVLKNLNRFINGSA